MVFGAPISRWSIETTLCAELSEHLGYEKHGSKPQGNARNGYTPKTLKSQYGEVDIATPRDREGSFEPQFIKKQQTRLAQMDDQILGLYAKGMATHEIADTFKEMYDADVSPTLVSKVTDAVKERVVEYPRGTSGRTGRWMPSTR